MQTESMHLRRPDETPDGMSASIAFAIAGSRVTQDKQQKHVGMAYRSINSEIMLLHLGWHNKLCHHKWDKRYYWIELGGLSLELQETFADWVLSVSNNSNSSITYSIIFRPGRYFDAGGNYIEGEDGSGLTCATFLMALFGDFGLSLVDVSQWPISRKGDLAWLRKILHLLKIHEVMTNKMPKWVWVEQFKQRHKLRRFRPEEVFVSAAFFSGKPLDYDTLEPAGRLINSMIPA